MAAVSAADFFSDGDGMARQLRMVDTLAAGDGPAEPSVGTGNRRRMSLHGDGIDHVSRPIAGRRRASAEWRRYLSAPIRPS